MFKKLKDKIAEEVKSSPQRIQQLTQSVTERIQNATSDESFFSIGDDDAPSSSPNPESGFSNVSLANYSMPISSRLRRNSNSSVASDMSFLPRYESASNLYHLQSDLDVSASEVEDNASTSSQLGHLSKEQIYAAFQKAQMRYHKYRGRYTDIANHYKELERENGKMKSVLVETQDKALRRVAELREQCSLEQKAKAHLENALRVELDEKQYVIDTLKTKINLLQASIKNEGKPELLVNVSDSSFSISDDPGEKLPNDNLEILTKDLKDARVEIENLNGKIQELKANAIVFGSKEADFRKKIADLEEVIRQKAQENAQVLERERENNLIIAQTKMELHTEIQNRDLEIENLKQDIEALKSDLERYESQPKSTKMENLQSQNGKLIEKVEDLTQKCNNYESELLKTEQLRIEIQNLNKIVESFKARTHELESGKAALEETLREKDVDFDNLKMQYAEMFVEVNRLKETSATHETIAEENVNELPKTEQLRIEIQDLNKIIESFKARNQELEGEKAALEETLREKDLEFDNLKTVYAEVYMEVSRLKEATMIHESIAEENISLQEQLKQQQADYDLKFETYRDDTKRNLLSLETKIRDKLKAEYETKEEQLRSDFQEKLQQLSKTDNNVKETQLKLMEKEEQVKNLEETLKTLEEKLAKHVQKYNELEANHLELISESAEVRNKLSRLEKENAKLNSGMANMQKESLEFEGNLSRQQNEICALQSEKTSLQQQYETLKGENVQILEDNQTLQCDNERLRSKNASLQNENSSTVSQSDYTNLQLEKASLHEKITTLKMEISQLQNESAVLQSENAALTSDSAKLTKDNAELTSNMSQLLSDNAKLKRDYEQLANDNVNLASETSKLLNDYTNLHKVKTDLESQVVNFQQVNNSIQERFTEASKNSEALQKEVDEKHNEILLLKQKLTDSESRIQEKSSEGQAEITSLQTKLAQTQTELASTKQMLDDAQKTIADTQKTLETTQKSLESAKQAFHKKLKDQKAKFHAEVQNLNKEVLSFREKNEAIQACIEEYKQKLTEYEAGSLEKSSRLQGLTTENLALTQELDSLKQLLETSKADNSDLSQNLKQLQDELHNFKELLEASKAESSHLSQNLTQVQEELKQKTGEIQSIHDEKADLTLKLQNVLDENNNLKEQILQIQVDSSKNVSEAKSSNEALQRQLLNYESDLKAVSEEKEKLQGQVSRVQEVETQLSSLSDDYRKLQEEKLQILGNVEGLQVRTQELNSENHRLCEEISKLQDQETIHNEVLRENQKTKENYTRVLDEVAELKRRNNELSLDYNQISKENEGLLQELAEIKLKYETLDAEKANWSELTHSAETAKKDLANQLLEYKVEIEKLSQSRNEPQDAEKLESEYKSLKVQLKSLEEHYGACEKQKKVLEGQLRELEHQYSEIVHEKQLLQDEVQELKISPINMNNHTNNAEKLDNLDIIHAEKIYGLENQSDVKKLQEDHEKEISNLNEKLIQYKSLDLTNRSSIQFYENELQKLKNKNEKLNRKLDETLVTLNHCAELSTSTETEYLRNVLYNYMLGKEGLVLARVIAAVCKFDENQTEAILQREQQKQTLLGQLGFL